MSTRRTVERLIMWREGETRKSPRILEAEGGESNSKSRNGGECDGSRNQNAISINTNSDNNNNSKKMMKKKNMTKRKIKKLISGPATSTRSRKNRKIRPLQDVSAPPPPPPISQSHSPPPHQSQADTNSTSTADAVEQAHEKSLNDNDEPPWMPEKRLLENILDILQRRDTYEIFAEPVNPEEVKDYYDIIKEPMDFGTMRAKLHEGMYTSLDQFERDVFLISRNAMHFNSSTTIYFRQARMIDEVAKKVFHALKTDRENFEFEFSDTRRRTSRRPQFGAKGLSHSANPKLFTNMRSSSTSVNISSKPVPCPLSSSSNFRRSNRGNPVCSGAPSPATARDHEMPFAPKDGRRAGLSEAGRRCTYTPWASILEQDDSVVSTNANYLKPLISVNQQDTCYRESLMLFVKDLGSTAQMIAKRKLHESSAGDSNSQTWQFKAPNFQHPQSSISVEQRPPPTGSNTSRTLISKSTISENNNDRSSLLNTNGILRDYEGDRAAAASKTLTNHKESNTPSAFNGDIISSRPVNVVGAAKRDKVQNGSSSSIAVSRHLNISVSSSSGKSATRVSNKTKMDDNQVLPAESTMAYSQLDMLKYSLRNNQSLTTLWPSGYCPTKSCMSNCNDGGIATQGSQGVALNPQFTFDLPYLKTRLDQINFSRQDRFVQQWSGFGGAVVDKAGKGGHRVDESSVNPGHTDLVLQL